MSESLNIYQKLAKVRKQVEVVQKNKSGYGYKYVTDDELLAKITAGMDRYGLTLIPSIVPNTISVNPYTYKKTKKEKQNGQFVTYEETVNEFTTHADMVYTWVNNENPNQKIEVSWSLVGQQSDASQCFGSGLTYSMRYFLLKYFNVATPEDDPDNWRSKQREAEAAEDKALAEQIINVLDASIKAYLADHADKSDDVKSFVSKYVKNGNYFAITESVVATKLLDDFRAKFEESK